MKTKTMALAALLLASAGTAAMAQDDNAASRASERAQGRAEHMQERAQARFEARQVRPEAPPPRAAAPADRGGWSRGGGGDFGRGDGGGRQRFERPAQPTVAPTPPPAPEARPAPPAGERFRPNADGQRNWPGRGQGGGWSGGDQGRTGADRQDDEDRDELRQARQWGGRQGERWTFEGDRRVREDRQPQRPQSGWDQRNRQGQDRSRDDRRGEDRNRGDQNRTDRQNHGGWDRNDGRGGSGWSRNADRGRADRHSWDGDRRDSHGQPRWDRRRYPPVYQSQHRFRGPAWRPPAGYFSRAWVYGDILPRAWFVDDYRIWDWWNYGLPMPPPGYSWVRVGYDALLVDDFDGEVVQVVRLLFW